MKNKPFNLSIPFEIWIKQPTINERLKDAGAEDYIKDIQKNPSKYILK